jgi:hypothetical protein
MGAEEDQAQEFLREHVAIIPVDVPPAPAVKYRADFVTCRGESWASNALEFDTREAAEKYARDLAFGWTAVRMARVVETTHATREASDWTDPGPLVVDYR